MIDYIAYILVRGLNKILGFVPISISLWIGRRAGTVIFFFNKKRRLVAYANLKSAFCLERSPRELRRITKLVYQNMAQTFVEVLNLTKVNRKYVDKYVEVINMDRIRNASKSGRGTILLTAHFGDWELSSLVSAVEGFPIMVLVREQKMRRLNELLNRLRESNGCKVIRKGMQTKNILKALHGNNIVGILSDQDAGKNGVFVNFFGRPTSSHSGAMEIARHTGSLILPNFIVRTHGPYHKLYLEEYIDFKNTASENSVKENLQKFTALLESYIRKYPDQWLWLHKRWKSTPTRTVLVLNDGKAGHLNQSLSIARQIQRARSQQGYNISDTKIVIVDAKFRNNFFKNYLTHICAPRAGWRCHGCMRCMSVSLENNTYRTLVSTYADFVVSCGSSLAAINIFIARENNAKNVVIMKPSIFMGLRKFNLAIIPRHDNPPDRKNVVATTIAPNLIDRDTLAMDKDRLKNKFGLQDDKYAGVFIGGDNPEFSIEEDAIDKVVDNLLEFSKARGVHLLVTTSRRTGSAVERLLKKRLGGDPNCKLLIIANEDNPAGAVGGILGLCGVALVSGESISMISEAISSGRRTVVFKSDKKKNGPTKHETALKLLEQEGYVTTSKPENLRPVLEKAWDDQSPAKKIDDNEKIFTAIRRIV